MEEIHEGVYQRDDRIYTVNRDPGEDVYGENLRTKKGTEYRRWKADRSKLGAAVQKGMDAWPFQDDSRVLYLGAANGTTISHVSDICTNGIVFGLEYSPTVTRDLVRLAKRRDNIAPVLGDARQPDSYSGLVDQVDIVFQDVAQRDQFSILKRNTDMFLREGGHALIAIKTRSISSSRPVEKVIREQKERFSDAYTVEWSGRLEPYEQDHLFMALQKE